MPDWLSIHKPILINTIGHGAGAVIFGMLLYLFAVNRRRAQQERSWLPLAAAALAMLWNLGSLVGLATSPAGNAAADIVVAASFSVLSVLPAVLLDISLQGHYRILSAGGYVLSAAAVALHITDLLTQAPVWHFAALRLVTFGFAFLSIILVFLELRAKRASGSRLAGAMGLFLFAISIAHFGAGHARQAWSGEVALHHAGLPLALFVILQDYRFLLLDAFLRFVVNASLVAAALLFAIRVVQSPELNRHLHDPFTAGVLFVCAGLLLTLLVYLHNRLQGFLTRVIFLRRNVEDAIQELRRGALSSGTEQDYLAYAAEVVAGFMHAARFELIAEDPHLGGALSAPAAIIEPAQWGAPAWVQAVAPWRFSRGDASYLLLGQRAGGRRFLSEDFPVLARLSATIVAHVEQMRSLEMQNLVSRAELRALQAQINPHFLFNSLNTLYGTIDRGNAEARRMVLNLADVYRYLLRSDRTFIEIGEELRIVRAYLEIEELRLRGKLRTEVAIDESTLGVPIPLLSIQPLVENAVRHGVATQPGSGFVRLRIARLAEVIAVEISNSGECDPQALNNGRGIGLTNVRRRLQLCYGGQACLNTQVGAGVTTVGFVLPVTPLGQMAAAAVESHAR
jgi:two-component system, LytTR family, sensor kinase